MSQYNIFYLQFIFGTLSIISLFIIIYKTNNEDIFSKLFYLNFYLIAFLIIIFIYQNPKIVYGSGMISIFGHQIININSNGFSRYLLFLYIYIFVSFLLSNNLNFYKFLILLTISTLIFLYEGRVNIGILLIINLIIFLRKLIFLKSYCYFFLYQLHLLSFRLYGKINHKIIITLIFRTLQLLELQPLGKNIIQKKEYISSYLSINKISTGRYDKWKIILEYKQNITNTIFGNGPEFDRFLLNRYNKYPTGSDSANGILYLYLCGGILSVIFFLLLAIQQLQKIWKNLIINNTQNFIKNPKVFVSIICFLYILIRSLFENSFSVWSIDQVFFILFGCYWNFSWRKVIK